MCSFVKSAGVVIGWNENLHTLGPPWHMIGHPCITPTDFTNSFPLLWLKMWSLVKSAGGVIGWSENLHTLGPPWHMIGHPLVYGLGLGNVSVGDKASCNWVEGARKMLLLLSGTGQWFPNSVLRDPCVCCFFLQPQLRSHNFNKLLIFLSFFSCFFSWSDNFINTMLVWLFCFVLKCLIFPVVNLLCPGVHNFTNSELSFDHLKIYLFM